MKINIPFKTPTINHLYWHRGNIKILKTEARTLRDEITDEVNKQIYEYETKHLKDKQLKVEVFVVDNWFNLDDSIKKKDILNKEKFLIDSVFKALGIDDSHIFDCRFIKVHDNKEERTTISISEYISELQT